MTNLDDIMALIDEFDKNMAKGFDKIDKQLKETKDLIKRYDYKFEKEEEDAKDSE